MAVVRINWGIPLENKKVYEEIGKVMTLVLPSITKVIIADSEGGILELIDDNEAITELKEELNELKLRYIKVEFEEDSTEEE